MGDYCLAHEEELLGEEPVQRNGVAQLALLSAAAGLLAALVARSRPF